MPRSQQEIELFRKSFTEFVNEVNAGGVIRFYNSKKNGEILRDAMFALQKEQKLQYEQLWHKRLWGAIFAENIAKLEPAPIPAAPKTRDQLIEEKLENDRRQSLENARRPKRLTDEEIEEAEEAARQDAIKTATSIANRIKDNMKKVMTAAEIEQDQRDHPGKYCVDINGQPLDFSRDLTPTEAYRMARPAYKYFLQKRRDYIDAEKQQESLDQQAARTLRKLGSS